VTYNNALDLGLEGTWGKGIGDNTSMGGASAFGLSSVSSVLNPTNLNSAGIPIQSFSPVSPITSTGAGIYQIMGENYKLAGFSDIESMVLAMSESEDRQLLAMSSFLIGKRLHLSLQAHDWKTFARGYNGPNYAINQYDVRLNGEFQKYSHAGLPDLYTRAGQLYLTYLGFDPGPVDGVAAKHTLSALADFYAQKALQNSNGFDDAALAQLGKAVSELA
jgi:hypothetical protein